MHGNITYDSSIPPGFVKDPSAFGDVWIFSEDAEGNVIAHLPVIPEPVPAVVSMAQARMALYRAGLLSQVEDAVAAAGDEAKIGWQYAKEVSRNGDLVAMIAAAIGLSDTQIDDLFKAAISVTL